MPTPAPAANCHRCHTQLTPIYPGQTEHPLCSPAPTGWIPPGAASSTTGPDPNRATPMALALEHAARGWHVLPLTAASKRPLRNCVACRDQHGRPPHRIEDCPCLPAGGWCHGVRAATTDAGRIATWWARQPDAIPGIAAGPSRLVLVDIDNHATDPPKELAIGLLPGIDLTAEDIPEASWRDRSAYRDGRDSLRLLARLRGGQHPWPTDPAQQPVTVTTPSGGRHLWYRAPAENLRQALDPHSIAWQVDIKAGWSYGIAPAATTHKGTYRITSRDPANPGYMPDWLATEITRVATPRQHRPPPPTQPRGAPARANGRGGGPAAYLTTVINNGTARLTTLTDGRQRALAALAYQTGGLLHWAQLPPDQVTQQLITAGTTAGLPHHTATRIVYRSLTRGLQEPLPEPGIAPSRIPRPACAMRETRTR